MFGNAALFKGNKEIVISPVPDIPTNINVELEPNIPTNINVTT